jgi:ribose transport system substrate-binding protein
VKVIEYAPIKQQDIEEQLRQVEDAIQRRISAIAIAPIDSNAIAPALEKAVKAGIPVITTNTRAFYEGITSFVGVDNIDGGLMLGTYLAEKLNFTGNIVIVEGNPAGQTNIDRLEGFKKAFAKYPNIKILTSQPAMFRRDQAMSVMENILQTYSKIDAVVAFNDEMAIGAVQAIEAAGRKGILVTGFDGAPEGIKAIIAGRMVATLNQGPFEQGGYAVRAAVDVIQGKTISKWITTGGNIIDATNAETELKRFDGLL